MTVHLVGAGPGDPDLLTLRAASLLARADVIVHDRLVDDRILASAAPWAELIDVGKTPGSSSQQPGRDQRDPRRSRSRASTPWCDSRAATRSCSGAAARKPRRCVPHGLAVEVVPGISSSIAAPAAAGIPVTMRGVASGVTIVTAHQDPGQRARRSTGTRSLVPGPRS